MDTDRQKPEREIKCRLCGKRHSTRKRASTCCNGQAGADRDPVSRRSKRYDRNGEKRRKFHHDNDAD